MMRNRELRRLFLGLWDKAVGTPAYVKDDWQRLDELVTKLERGLPLDGPEDESLLPPRPSERIGPPDGP